MKKITLATIWPYLPLGLGGLSLILMGILGYGWYRYDILSKEYANTRLSLENRVSDLEGELSRTKDEKENLGNTLAAEQEKNTTFENQISDITSSVGTLKKLSETDKELLQKYSKVYFLNEHYVPEHLINIPTSYLVDPKRQIQIKEEIWGRLKDMIDDANDDGATIKISSGFRSFETQSSLKSSYSITYGAGTANSFIADQGYSEHQLGTAVDISTPEAPAGLTEQFEQTAAFKWMVANAWRYGFTLSYPKGNVYYIYEPWHWRFVGTALAKYLHNEDKHFYDLDQREIDKYLINIFD